MATASQYVSDVSDTAEIQYLISTGVRVTNRPMLPSWEPPIHAYTYGTSRPELRPTI